MQKIRALEKRIADLKNTAEKLKPFLERSDIIALKEGFFAEQEREQEHKAREKESQRSTQTAKPLGMRMR